MTCAVELSNYASLSVSCYGPQVVLSTPKVDSYTVHYHDGQTLWPPLKNYDGYTSIVASTPWQQLQTSTGQKCGSLIAQDFPTAL